MRLADNGNTRRWITGIPAAQQTARRSTRRGNARRAVMLPRNLSAVRPLIDGPSGVPASNGRAIEAPNELMATRCCSVSVVRRLNFPSPRHTNRGRSSSRSDWGSSPSFLARENRSSARAEMELAASSLHQSGHAALIAGRLKPRFRSSRLNFVASLSTRQNSPVSCAVRRHRQPL